MTKHAVMPHVALLHQAHLMPSKVEKWDVKLVWFGGGGGGEEVGVLSAPGLSTIALLAQSCLYLTRTPVWIQEWFLCFFAACDFFLPFVSAWVWSFPNYFNPTCSSPEMESGRWSGMPGGKLSLKRPVLHDPGWTTASKRKWLMAPLRKI